MSDTETSGGFLAPRESRLPDAAPGPSAGAQALAIRAAQEVRQHINSAKEYPRDERRSVDRIMGECDRYTLAEKATYQYPRGGQVVRGPSIRLAESIARQWGNLQAGITELGHVTNAGEPYAEAEAYCVDFETNYRTSRIFRVSLVRHTKQSSYTLTDPRDIYEQIANMGARRKRACILDVIPGDITEMAVARCEETLRAKIDMSADRIQKMILVFGEEGVSKAQLEARLGRRVETIQPAEMVTLGSIYQSIKDGMSAATDWFDPIEGDGDGKPAAKEQPATDLAAKVRQKTAAKKATPKAKAAPDAAPEAEPKAEPKADAKARKRAERNAKAKENAAKREAAAKEQPSGPSVDAAEQAADKAAAPKAGTDVQDDDPGDLFGGQARAQEEGESAEKLMQDIIDLPEVALKDEMVVRIKRSGLPDDKRKELLEALDGVCAELLKGGQ